MTLGEIYRQIITTYEENRRRKKFDRSGLASRYLYRPLSIYAAVFYIKMGFSANGLTVFNLVFLIASLACFAGGTWNLQVAGAFLFLWFYITDYADGTIARFHRWTNFYGKLIDGYIDTYGFLIFIAIGWSNTLSGYNHFPEDFEIWLGVLITISVLLNQYYHIRLAHFLNQSRMLSGRLNDTKKVNNSDSSNIVPKGFLSWVAWTKENIFLATPLFLIAFTLFKALSFFLLLFLFIHLVLGSCEILVSLKRNYKELSQVSTKLRL